MHVVALRSLYKKVKCAKSEYIYQYCVKSGPSLPACPQQVNPGVQIHSRCSVSSVKRSARSATVSTAASECFMAVLVWLEREKLLSVRFMGIKYLLKCTVRPHLFSAVLSIACILSSMVDLIRNLWTNVGLVDRKQVRWHIWHTHETVWNFSWSLIKTY